MLNPSNFTIHIKNPTKRVRCCWCCLRRHTLWRTSWQGTRAGI